MSVKGKHVIVAGGSGALGAVISSALIDEGATVLVLDKHEHERAYTLICDLTDAEFVELCIDEAVQRSGPVDGLVLCAGSYAQNPIEALRDNFLTALNPLRRVLPMMLKRNAGAVVALTGDYALASVPGVTAYATAKGAVNGLMREAAQRCAGYKVRVNTLLPGVNACESGALHTGEGLRPEQMQLIRTPFSPQLCAENVLFLLSERSKGITGQQWRLDGGMQAVAHPVFLM